MLSVVVVAVVFKPLLPQFSVEVSRFVCFDIFSFKKRKKKKKVFIADGLNWVGKSLLLSLCQRIRFIHENKQTNKQNLILH